MIAVLLVLSVLVSSGVIWSLRGTGISMTDTPMCGQEEHQHNEECYEDVLICGQEETQHVHTEDCFQTEKILICGQMEQDGQSDEGHTHTDDCYRTEQMAVCGAEEKEGHQHTQECYEHQMVCGQEEHQHTEECYPDDSADLENADVWEKTLPDPLPEKEEEAILAVAESQIGYAESSRNFILDDNGNKKGYTRYGEWYGSPYGDWNAMFASFCLKYAGISDEKIPYAAGCHTWQVKLAELNLWKDTQYTPMPGDLVFFDLEERDGNADYVGIVKSVDEEQQMLHTIEGDAEDAVAERGYALGDETILGYCSLKAEKTDEQIEAAPEEEEAVSAVAVEPESAAAGEEVVRAAGEEVVRAAGEEIVRAAGEEISGAPAAGPVRGRQVNDPVEGEWYIIYDFLYDGNSTGYALNAAEPNTPIDKKLAKASDGGGVVEYGGAGDVVWQYTSQGFRNRYGQYLTLAKDNSNVPFAGVLDISTNTANANTKYIPERRIIYNESIDTWNYLYFGGGNYPGCRTSPFGSQPPYPSDWLRNDQPTFIAKVDDPQHPPCAVTGDIEAEGLSFFNIDGTGAQAAPLPGVEYTIWKKGSGNEEDTVAGKYITSNSYMRSIGILPDGEYYIEQTGVPEGYVVVPQHKEFTVQDGKAVIGVFYDYKMSDYETDKTAEVVDYANRTYKVDLSSRSGKYKYYVENENYQVIVDQSNSMLFPANLTKVAEVELYTNDKDGKGGTNNRSNSTRIDDVFKAKGLSKDKLYYLITDQGKTSTVWALWKDNSSGKWLYQDASYYVKAMNAAGDGNNLNEGKPVRFPKNEAFTNADYADEKKTQVIRYVGGGGMNAELASMFQTDSKKVDSDGRKHDTFDIYEGSEFNRLHYLQESLLVLINQLASLNKDNTLSLITFDKDFEECKEEKLNDTGVQELMKTVNKITTSGGTRPNIALNHARTHGHIKNDERNRIILITDGAPVPSGDEYPVTFDDVRTAADKVDTGQNTLITIGLSMQNVVEGSKLLKEIATGGATASEEEKWWFQPNDTSDLVKVLMEDIFVRLTKRQEETTASNIKDVISDSFYPINPDTKEPLSAGTWIGLDGHVIPDPDPTSEETPLAGQVLYDEEKEEWYVEWKDQTLPTPKSDPIPRVVEAHPKENDIIGKKSDGTYYLWTEGGNESERVGKVVTDRYGTLKIDKEGYSKWGYDWYDILGNGHGQYYGDQYIDLNSIKIFTTEYYTVENDPWHGTVYLKAKEDFIGGNVIDTNKSATFTLEEGSLAGKKPLELPTPTVNVRLLPIAEASTEETVFLGDTVNPKERIQSLLDAIRFTKIKSNSGDAVYNRTAASEAEGLEADSFTLAYAMKQKLTDAQWEELVAGRPVIVDYTYDDASSHGAVGYFTLTLTKEKADSDYAEHSTKTTGKDVEIYKLGVQYIAYKYNEPDQSNVNRPSGNVHNGSNGPGTEVGGQDAGDTLPTGHDVLNSNNIHKVHVVDGKIKVIKEIEDALVNTGASQTYVFTLQQLNSSGSYEEVIKDGKAITLTVTVEANKKTGKEDDYKSSIGNLPRGTYKLVETTSETYNVKNMTVVDAETNCKSAGSGTREVTFTIGTDADGTNVIQENPTKKSPYSTLRGSTPASETECKDVSYGTVKVVNEKTIYTAEIPVEKRWSQVPENQYSDLTVYVALYQNDSPVKDAEGRVLVLALDKENGWKGSFTVPLQEKNQDVTELGYSIREIGGVSTSQEDGKPNAAVVVNKNDSLIYYEKILQAHELIEIGGEDYSPEYSEGENGTLIVTNSFAYSLPKTGGLGTTMYIVCGLALMAGSFLYGCGLRYRRRERRLKG